MPKDLFSGTIKKVFNRNQIGVFNILRSIKNVFIHIRSSLKLIFLIIIAAILIVSLISVFYKVTYTVTLNGEFVGYTNNKAELQKKINEYMEKGEEDNTAFVDIETVPEYSLCLVKKDSQTNDDEIFEKIKSYGKTYYEYYAILLGKEEKYYVATKEDAEQVISTLTSKKSNNIKKISYSPVFGTEMKSFTDKDTIVTALYEKPVVTTYSGPFTLASSEKKVDLGISLIKPISSGYTITSRYGIRNSGRHSGLDVAAPYGTPIHASASGTVTVVKSLTYSYGKYLIIDHGNGVETLYGHCSEIYVSVGQSVSQGETIAAVGSTGNSTGNHLHLEIRANKTALNPQNYLY